MAQMVAKEVNVAIDTPMKYWLYAPFEVDGPMPLVVFLHGGGESGDDIELVKKHGLPKLIEEGQEFPFYMFAPQNPFKAGLWDDQAVDKMVDVLVDSLDIDPNRIYLMGLSRGGYGVWRMAINKPEKYASMVSICAASIPMLYTSRLGQMPVWFFHGAMDQVVPVEISQTAYGKMKGNGQNVKITIYPEANHDSWTRTFENEEVYEWLLEQQRE